MNSRNSVAGTTLAVLVVLVGAGAMLLWSEQSVTSSYSASVDQLHGIAELIHHDVARFHEGLAEEARTAASDPTLMGPLRVGMTGDALLGSLRSVADTAAGVAYVTDMSVTAWPESAADRVASVRAPTQPLSSAELLQTSVIGPLVDDDGSYFATTTPVVLNERIVGSLIVFEGHSRWDALFTRYWLGQTIDVYAVDRTGRALSKHRFADPLYPAESGEAYVIEPTTGTFTLAAAAIADGHSGSSADPYVDYSGRSVLGAWIWDEHFDMGFVAEVDASESVGSASTLLIGTRALIVVLGGVVIYELLATRRRQAQLAREVHEKTLQLESIIEALPDLLVVTDADGHVVEAFHGTPEADEVVGEFDATTDLDEVFRGLPLPVPTTPPAPTSEPAVAVRTWEEGSPSGTRHFEARSIPIPELSRSIAVIRNITAQVTHERSLEAEVREKDAFLATVSHEIRTPLTTVIGLLELLADPSGPAGDEARELLELAAIEAHDLNDIVNDLVTLKRATHGGLDVRCEPMELGPITHQVVESMSRRLGRAIELEISGAVGVSADPQRVRQVIRNLISNAHVHGGPDISVEIGVEEGFGHVTVRDDGAGVPPSLARRIFDRYVSTGGKRGRTDSLGIGLALSRDLSRRMGGDLRYERHADTTSFRLTLPLATSPVGAKPST